MKLIDILLESKASEDAKRLGLVKKPGFGLYGPQNGPATHQSRGGKLTVIGQSAQQDVGQMTSFQNVSADIGTVAPKKPRAVKKSWDDMTWQEKEAHFEKRAVAARKRAAEMPDLPQEPPSAEEVAKVEERMARRKTAPPTTRVAPLAARILQALPDGIIKDPKIPVAVISQYYGRTDVPQIYMGEDLKKRIKPDHKIISDFFRTDGALGIYMYRKDLIGVRGNIDKRIPMSNWQGVHSYNALHVLVHEAIHGITTGGFGAEAVFKRDARGIAINEGLTEVMAQSIISGIVENDDHYERMRFGDPETRAYSEFTRAIRLMEKFGGLDIDYAIRNHSKVNEEGESVVLAAAEKAQIQTIQTLLTDIGLEKSKIDELLELIRQGWANGEYLLATNSISKMLRTIGEEGIGTSDKESIYQQIMDVAKKQALG